MRLPLTVTALLCASLAAPDAARARASETDATAGITAFVENCFSPLMTAGRAAEVFDLPTVRHEFYDLDPFSSAAPSPVTGRTATPGTDRRCEVSFDLDHAARAAEAVIAQLAREGITDPAPLPPQYTENAGTTLLAARFLNLRRIAVVHVGTRPGPSGIEETFLMVERLVPLDTQ